MKQLPQLKLPGAGLLDKTKAALPKKPDPGKARPLDVARARVRARLDSLGSSPIGSTPAGQALQRFLQQRLAADGSLDAFLQALNEKSRDELARRKQMAAALQQMLRTHFSGGAKPLRLRSEVLMPARTQQLSCPQAWARIEDIALGRPAQTRSAPSATTGAAKPMFPLLDAFERRFGNLYFTVSLKAEAGFGVGGSSALGIGGMRHREGFFTTTRSLSLGTTADAQGGIEFGVSLQKPENAAELTLEAAVGGGAGMTGELTVSWKPKPGLGLDSSSKPAWHDHDGLLLDYEFAGLSAASGFGGGFDASGAIAYGESLLLRGPTP